VINPYDFFKQAENKDNIIRSYSEIKHELNNLGDAYDLIENFEKHSFFHNEFFHERSKNKHLVSEIKFLNSEIRDKDLINERLQSLGNNLGSLRTIQSIKDISVINQVKHGFFENSFSGIPAIINELKDFKDKLNKLEGNYYSLINEEYSSIDFKVRHQHHLEEHLKNLNKIYEKQNNLLISMGMMFTKHFKEIIRKKK